jgi:hypothetical protein
MGPQGREVFAERERLIPYFVPDRLDRERSRPSGLFCWRDGTFLDPKDNTSISFFDQCVVLGKYTR